MGKHSRYFFPCKKKIARVFSLIKFSWPNHDWLYSFSNILLNQLCNFMRWLLQWKEAEFESSWNSLEMFPRKGKARNRELSSLSFSWIYTKTMNVISRTPIKENSIEALTFWKTLREKREKDYVAISNNFLFRFSYASRKTFLFHYFQYSIINCCFINWTLNFTYFSFFWILFFLLFNWEKKGVSSSIISLCCIILFKQKKVHFYYVAS